MTAHLPPPLLALFAPRPPIPYLPPPEKRPCPSLSGIAAFVNQFQEELPDPEHGRDPFETKKLRKKRKLKERMQKNREQMEEVATKWDPTKDTKATSDPYKTLFVSKMNFNTTEHKLKREFEIYGPVKKIRVIQDKAGKPRGYAFIEYEREKDMRNAYKQADGKKIDGQRVLVDVERGRTVRNWRPRRFGGGLGMTRATSEERAMRRASESSRETSRDKDPEKERERERERRDRADKEKERGDRDRGDRDRGDRDRERDRERGGRDRERERDRGEKRHRDRSKDRERERGDRDKERERDKSPQREGIY